MVEIWNEYLTDHPYSTSLIGQGGGVFILRVYEDVLLPQAFAVATGEWINHLRSALDYTIWAAAAYASGKLPPPNQGQIQYPIYDSAAAWERNLYRLNVLAAHQRAMLLTMQPFNSDPDANLEFPRFRGHLTAARFGVAERMCLDVQDPAVYPGVPS